MSIYTSTKLKDVSDNSSSDLIISFYLLKKCKLWVWDFDDTLIDTKYYYKASMDPADIRNRTDTELTNEVPQWRYFKRLIEYLVKHGKYVAIASFGTYEIIKAYMDRIMGFNQTFFTNKNLIAPNYTDRECRSFKLPPNKNEYIYKIMKMYKIEDFTNVVLFDDLPSNIADAIGVGIIAIQIATPNNGDSSGSRSSTYGSGGVSYSGNNMFFGPWLMEAFDKKVVNDCGKEIYLNKTFTGITNNSKTKSNKNSNTITYTGMSYDKTKFSNGIKDGITEKFSPVAFGTSIGDRKISINPEYRWNKMNISNPPEWVNGNWENNLKNDTGNSNGDSNNWSNSTIGGKSISFWDKYYSVNNINDKGKINNGKNINNYNGKLNENSNEVMGVSEGFENNLYDIWNKNYTEIDKKNGNGKNEDDCNTCRKFEWNWIVLSLIIVILMMIIIIYNVI